MQASFGAPGSKEWAAAQITAAQGDYTYISAFWNKLSNGLNNQTLHHLFPSVHPCHYPALSELLKPVFDKHKLPVAGWERSYWQSLASHVRHLRKLNDERWAG
eukprot:SAG22_NODE_2257_length_2780_cov_2.690041_1_plen_103_part_00